MLSIHIGCHLPIVQIKEYNAMTNGRKFWLLRMLLGTLSASLLENMLAGKGKNW